MSEKCTLCGEEIKETFLGKVDGTIIKTKEKEKLIKKYICPNCQKENKNNLKDLISKS